MTDQAWHPVALARDIAAGTSAGTALAGADIVVWRNDAGAIAAWEDRCPHRGMKLSFGFVRGDHIACLYHGWQFNQTGRCQYIPAHPDLEVPKSICTKIYPVAEAGGLIWVWPDLTTPPTDAPTLPEGTPLRSLYLDADVAQVLAALPALGWGDITPIAPHLYQAGDLILGLQQITTGRAALHVTSTTSLAPEALSTLLSQTESLRRMVEAAQVAA